MKTLFITWWNWKWKAPFRYMETLCRLGYSIPELSPSLCHIIASGMLGGLVEIVVHDIPQEQALRDVEQLREFYTAGWLKTDVAMTWDTMTIDRGRSALSNEQSVTEYPPYFLTLS